MKIEKPGIVIFDMDGTTVRHINIYLLHVLEKLDDFSYAVKRFAAWLSPGRSARLPALHGHARHAPG